MDNASYHSRKVEKCPTTAWNKGNIQQWLHSKNIAFPSNLLKVELLKLVQDHKPAFNNYLVHEMALRSDRHVLRLPPYHCELNPIELVWAQIKNEVASKNTRFKLSDVHELFFQAVSNITADNWQKCVKHAIF